VRLNRRKKLNPRIETTAVPLRINIGVNPSGSC
jgi:hypothetical protein